MADRISISTSTPYDEPAHVDSSVDNSWGQTSKIDSGNDLIYDLRGINDRLELNSNLPWSKFNYYDSGSSLTYNPFQDLIDVPVDLPWRGNPPKDIGFYIGDVTVNDPQDCVSKLSYFSLANQPITWKDSSTTHLFEQVWLFDKKPIPPGDFRYLVTSDFEFDNSELAGFTADFIKPIDFNTLRTRLSPIRPCVGDFPWSRSEFVDIYTDIKWGYYNNQFLIGGSTDTGYDIDEDATEPEPEPEPGEVITFVNSINIFKLPERTAIQFDNLSLAYDIDSVSWVVNFDVPDQATANLIKPVGLTVTEIEVNINGEIWICFIGRTSTSTSVGSAGTVQRRIRCSGWSVHKLLSYPYSPRRSHVETSQSTPAGLLAGELTGSGFTGNWNSVSWTLPENTFTYIDKAPLASISELAQEVGAVLIPDPANKIINVEPRYPVSPWSWDASVPDISLSESQCFSIDTEWIPQQSPDSIYCYGEAVGGVAVKVVRSGQPGTVTLPTITSSYFTDTVPAQERGRIEIAANGHKEIVPVSTYVNPTDGILQPLQLVEVTELDGITTWRGQIVGIGINLKRNGHAIVQTIQLERHYAI